MVGFTIIEAHEIDEIGMNAIIAKVRKTVGDTPVYLSIDIDGMEVHDSLYMEVLTGLKSWTRALLLPRGRPNRGAGHLENSRGF